MSVISGLESLQPHVFAQVERLQAARYKHLVSESLSFAKIAWLVDVIAVERILRILLVVLRGFCHNNCVPAQWASRMTETPWSFFLRAACQF